jgi:hypothetical protein
MRASYKDNALAKMQARNLYFEAAKEKMMAEAGKYDSPAIKSRLEMGLSAINREQAKMDVNEAVRKAAAAQAAGAARASAADRELKHRMDLQKLQNETLTANANAMKAMREGGKDDAKERREAVKHIGDKLSEIDKQGNATDIESLHRYLVDPKTGKVDRSRDIPGVGRLADAREGVGSPVTAGDFKALPVPVVGGAYVGGRIAASNLVGLSPEERQNRNAYERSFLSFKNIKTGSASSEEEHRRLVNAWDGAKTTEEIAAAVDQAYNFLQRNKDAIRAEDPEATAEYEQNQRDLAAKDRANTVRRTRP